MLGNTAVKLVHRQMVPESAERLAAAAGTEQVWEETLQVTHADPLAVGEATGGATGLGSLRRVDRFRVHPNTIKDLPRGRAVVLVKHPATRLEVVDVVMAGAAAAAPG